MNAFRFRRCGSLWGAAMVVVVAIWLAGTTALAADYYIDYAGGDDTQVGSKEAPWQRHPYMQGFAGSYAPADGDRFIFKGGVVWPGECFGLIIQQGGSAEQPHVYTVDETWFDGEAWSRPVFDMQNQVIVGNKPVSFLFASNVVFNGFEIRNQRIWGPKAYGWGGVSIDTSENITVSNCYIHDWIVAEPTVTADHEFGGIWSKASPGTVVDGCVIHGQVEPITGKYSGTGIRNGGTTLNCEIYDVPNGLLGGGTIRNCNIHHIYTSYDSGTNVLTPPNGRHANGVYLFGNTDFVGNWVHDVLAAGAPVVFPAAGWNGVNGTALIYNNIIQGGIHLNGDGLAAANEATWLIYNNMIVAGNAPIVASKKSNNPAGHVHIMNNVIVSTGTYPCPINLGQTVADLQIDYNLHYNSSPSQNLVGGQPCVLYLNWVRRQNLAQTQADGFNLHS
ncbi:MAG: right-handed parallel beta-helix repeat-containing protein, partial [Planctomycetes bacterium]|nr:right-handed parallel beta-helix repeat-containing protein [Planctomycetota bacterium]